ncbi:MAG: hypothetical protein JWR90_4281 [Marmoricola sp.]|jgi:hypothetical protein|nr:hypothetical protein [Marmoricola sp.]
MHRRSKLLVPAAVLCTLAFAGCAEVDEAASAGGADPTPSAAAPTKQASVKHKTVRIRKSIPFSSDTVKTGSLDKGVVVVDQEGQPGVSVRVVRLTLKNGVEVGRELVRTVVKQRPVAQVKLLGTHVDPKPKPEPASNCDPNYAGACVPVASDVDCAGGGGDGPEYVQGPVEVVGSDVYDLNRDDDNIACDG